MAQSTAEEIIRQASQLSSSEKQRVVAALTAEVNNPPHKRIDAYGQFSHVPGSVSDFLSQKAMDTELEEHLPFRRR